MELQQTMLVCFFTCIGCTIHTKFRVVEKVQLVQICHLKKKFNLIFLFVVLVIPVYSPFSSNFGSYRLPFYWWRYISIDNPKIFYKYQKLFETEYGDTINIAMSSLYTIKYQV